MELEPNRDDIEAYLDLIISPWRSIHPTAQLEFRALKPGNGSRNWLTSVNEQSLCASIDKVVELNSEYWNVYVTVNPISPDLIHPSAKDADVIGAYYLFADADTKESAALIDQTQTDPTFRVVTGTKPHLRLHAYWQIVGGLSDMEQFRLGQERIIDYFKSDSIQNPSRIMRIAGTVSWPPQKKQDQGYEAELTSLEDFI